MQQKGKKQDTEEDKGSTMIAAVADMSWDEATHGREPSHVRGRFCMVYYSRQSQIICPMLGGSFVAVLITP